MAFSIPEVEVMQQYLARLEPGTQGSLQLFYPEKKNTTHMTLYVKDKKGKYIYVFQYYNKLSPYRIKLIQQLAKKIPYPLQMVTDEKGYVCVGWKYTV